jgi:hypothetical protein
MAFLLTVSFCPRQRSKHSIVPSLESIVRKETFYSKKERNLFSINELLNGSSAAQNPPNAHPMESRFNDDRRKGGLLQNSKDIMDGLSLVAFSVIAACLLISWEDLTCKYVLPSRHRTSLTLYQSSPLGWGASTTNGMGFGSTERQMLLSSSEQASTLDDGDPMLVLPSYNEVMLQHRTKTVPQWKHTVAPSDISSAIHTYVAALQKLEILQSMADDYQWDEIRFYLHSSPISDLASQSAVLRQFSSDLNEIVGFDWGSCAWRHCGAIADVQEAVDELDQLLGVLEPYEAVFCLDIVERCLRDVLTVVPWKYASADDKLSYASMPVYLPKTPTHSLDTDVSSSRIDDTYFRALQELRID